MKYPLSYVAAEHQKEKKKQLLFSVSLASHAAPLETRRQQEGVGSGLNGRNSKERLQV